MADICLVSITKVRGGLLWLLSAWSMSLKGAEHYVIKCAECSEWILAAAHMPTEIRRPHFYDSKGPISLPKTLIL